jgi:MoxR-like ATPase
MTTQRESLAIPPAGLSPQSSLKLTELEASLGAILRGKPDVVRLSIVCLLARGHLLIEDVPGVGKTTLAQALARSVSCSFHRLQFTSDMLPSDVLGVTTYNAHSESFEFKPGPIFSNFLLADEINRTTPKTQSALLEAMNESQVTIDGQSHTLPRPFMVIATQNPVEMEGTYPLPEAQRDRFMARISIGYPDRDSELSMLDTHGSRSPLDDLKPVAHAADIRALVAAVRDVHVSGAIRQYIIDLVSATRTSAELRLGASPRAALHLLRATRAFAALDDRDFVIPDDVQTLAVPVLAHRLLPSAEAMVGRELPDQVLSAIVRRLPLPAR